MEAFQEMCLEALSAGAVQSFVDLMYLASRGVKESSELESTRQCLLVSEAARRRGDTAGVIAQCTQLGRAFEASGDTVVSVFFVKRGLEVAKLTGDSASQLGCYHQLALSYERANDLDSALAYHDAHCGLAQQLGNAQQEVLACEVRQLRTRPTAMFSLCPRFASLLLNLLCRDLRACLSSKRRRVQTAPNRWTCFNLH
jgi:hypothetical protein